MTVDVATLQIRIDSTEARAATRDLGAMQASGARAEQQAISMASAFRALGAALAVLKIVDLAKESAMLAARFETMGVVMRVAGNNAGYTGAQMTSLEQQLQKTGISAIKSREALTSLATANIDLSKSAELARAAQDLAVVGNINSSEAFSRLVAGIKSGEVEVLRTLGLNVNFENSYKTMAAQLHTTTEKLTDHQKVQARTSVTLKEAANYAGIYEEAMGTAGKQINSLSRYVEDLKVKLGSVFLPILAESVAAYTDALKAANKETDSLAGNGKLELFGSGLKTVFDATWKSIAVALNYAAYFFQTVGSGIGAVAAQAAALAHGDLKAAVAISKEWQNDTLAGANAANAFANKLLFSGEAAAKSAAQIAAEGEATKAAASVKEAARIAAGNAARAAQEAEAKRLAASEKARAEQKKYDEAYKQIIKTTEERTATSILDMETQGQLTEGQKYAVKVLDDLRTGVIKLSVAQKIKLSTDLEAMLAAEAANKKNTAYTAQIKEDVRAREEAIQTLKLEYAVYGLSSDARDVALAGLRAEFELRKRLDQAIADGVSFSKSEVQAIRDTNAERVKAEQATMAQSKALGYATQLVEENKKFAAESIFDEKARADAILAIDSANWQARITLAGEGTEAQRLLQEQYVVWYQNQLSKPQLDAQKQLWGSIESTAHDTFISIFDSGKSAFDRLRDTLKNGLLELLYQMTAKKWIMNIGASVSGVAGAAGSGIPGAAGAASNILSGAGSLSSIYNAATGSIAGSVGGGISSIGSFLGSASIADFGAGLSGSASAEAMAAALAGDVAAPLSAAASAGASLASAFSVALPWVAAAGAAYLVWKNFFEDGPEQNTHLTFGSNNAAGNISINERGNEGKNAAYIDNYGKSSLGTFGVTNSFWMSSDSDVVQSFIKTVSQTDDALAAFLTTTEKASVSSYLTGKTATAQTGAEGSNPNASGALDKVFADRINNILTGVEPGLASLVSGFSGTSQALATEAAALLSYRAALKDSGEAVFGAKVTLQDLAALKAPTEATSVALTRITSEFQATNQVASMFGVEGAKAFGAVGLASEAARAQVILLSGGLSSFSSQASDYAQNFLSDAQRMAPVAKQLDAALGSLGLSTIPTTKVQFAALVDQLVSSGALATEQGAKQFAGLMAVESAFAQVHASEAAAVRSASDIASERADLQKQLDEATLTSAQLLAKQRDALDASNKALFDQVQAATAAKAAADALASTNAGYQQQIDALLKANMSAADVRALETKGMDASTVALYDRLAALHTSADAEKAAAAAITRAQESAAAATQSFGNALTDSITKAHDAAKAFRALNEALLVGDMSTLSPEQKYAEAKRQFEAPSGANQATESAFLAASKAWFGGSAGYAADFAAVLARNTTQALLSDIAAASLPGEYRSLMSAYSAVNGSHANGLNYVPFDGYRAELHKGERVQTAAAVRNGDQAANETNALLREMLVELRADKPQRAAVADATLNKIGAVADKLEKLERATRATA